MYVCKDAAHSRKVILIYDNAIHCCYLSVMFYNLVSIH